jgi:O-antigen biosynthesis protein
MLGMVGEVIKLKGQATIAWAEFDAAWYLQRYPDAGAAANAAAAEDVNEAALQHYLVSGQQIGHSPNPYFDEPWYLAQYPEAATAVTEGKYASGFDEYCQVGYGGRSPHWLYNDYIYRMAGEELTPDAIRAEGFANRYDHYLRQGSRQGRIAHPLFDPTYYRTQLDEAEAASADELGAFRHFLLRIAAGHPAPRTSLYFDPVWYARSYPAVAAEIGNSWVCALHHYLTNDTPMQFDPLPDFSEVSYLDRNADIAAGVEAGNLRNGYQHFLSNGVFELRSPNDIINLRHYVSVHDSVATDLQAGRARDAFAHLLAFGRAEGLAPAPIAEADEDERHAKALFRLKAENLLPLFARQPLDFSFAGTPDVSVIMVLRDNFALTLQALSSLRQSFPGSIELILIDSGSSDETRFITRYVHGAQLMRFDTNIGFVRAANAGIMSAAGDAVLLLNNDLELGPDALLIAARRLSSDPGIGAVGAKIIRTHGRLQEAGSIIWRDGVTLGYMRDASPLAPEVNFVRDVDFCSAAFLLVRADLLNQLDGFRDEFAPAYYEDADLCVRITQTGFRVVYDPLVVIHHYEYGSAAAVRAVEAQSDRSRRVFVRENMNYLRTRYLADRRATIFARSASVQRRILFIEDQVPLRSLGSGFVRSNDILGVMASLGFHVTVFPIFGGRFDVAAIYADIPETVEVMYDRSLEDLAEFLNSRDGYYDTIWLARTHNLDRVRPVLERHVMGKGLPPRIILDTEAVASLRDATRAELNGETFDLDAATAKEFQNALFCQSIITVTEQEAQYLRSLRFAKVSVVGHVRELALTGRDFTERCGLLFVGGIHALDSPNYDGLCWFVESVLPLVEKELGYETQLTIAGYTAAGVSLERFQNHPRITLKGEVVNPQTLYNANRVFVAPTRFAAGAPYKVYEAASFGLPVVATDLLCKQLGWDSGNEMLCSGVTDSEQFARNVVALYRDPELWLRIRANAANRLRVENGREQYVQALQAIL